MRRSHLDLARPAMLRFGLFDVRVRAAFLARAAAAFLARLA
jgi:hypothetical protein